jgi:hypothetical protein
VQHSGQIELIPRTTSSSPPFNRKLSGRWCVDLTLHDAETVCEYEGTAQVWLCNMVKAKKKMARPRINFTILARDRQARPVVKKEGKNNKTCRQTSIFRRILLHVYVSMSVAYVAAQNLNFSPYFLAKPFSQPR